MKTLRKLVASLLKFPLRILILISFTTSNSAGQSNPQWLYMSKDEIIYDVAFENQNVWVAAEGGLVKLDPSTNQTTFFHELDAPLAKMEIQSLCIDDNNNIWAGTLHYGFTKFDGTTWETYSSLNGIDSISGVTQIEKDNSGNIYLIVRIYMQGSLLYKYDGNVFSQLLPPYPISSSGWADKMVIDSLDNIWCASASKQLMKYDGMNWYTFDSLNSPINEEIISLAIDPSNNLWVSTDNIYKWNGSNWTLITSPGSNLNGSFLDCDALNNVWFWKYNSIDPVISYDGSSFFQYSSATFNGNPYIRLFETDPTGNIWTFPNIDADTLLYKFDGTSYTGYYTSNSMLRNNLIRRIKIDNNGNRWFANDNQGLQKWDGNTWFNFDTLNSGIEYNYLRCINIDSNNNVWMGYNGGSWNFDPITKFDGNTWTSFSLPFVNSPYVDEIEFDQFNNVWVVIFLEGIAMYDGMNWTYWDDSYFGSGSGVNDLVIDTNNVVWVSASGRGLFKYQSGNWIVYNTSNSGIPSNNIASLDLDNYNNLWMRIHTDLVTFDGVNFTIFNTDSIDGTAYSVAQDNFNNYWFGSDKGVTKYDGSTWTNFNIYNSGIGICNPIGFPGVSYIEIDQNNTLWMCGTRGVSVYNENGIPLSTHAEKSPQLLKIYPNPFLDKFTVDINNERNLSYTLEVFNVTGQTFLSMKDRNSYFTCDLKNAAAGTYFIRITTEKSIQWVKAIKN